MKARTLRTCGMLFACMTLGMLGACGDDDTGDAGVVAGTGGGAGGATAGTSGGGAGKAGGGAAGMAAPVTCGASTCTVNAVLKMINPAATACCSTNMKCGNNRTDGKCIENNQPGTPDKSCPDIVVTVSVGGAAPMPYPQAGCCTPTKKCGGNFTATGWGCIAREDVGTDMGGPLMAMACGTGDGGSADAGL